MLLEIADLASAMLASLLIWFLQIEYSYTYSCSAFFAAAILSFLLLPSKLPFFYFSTLFGWYPIAKQLIEQKISKRLGRFLCKATLAIAAVTLEEALARSVLGYIQTFALTAVIVITTLFCYVMYDILLSRFTIVYYKKLRRYIFRK